jgi:hypothetical protein
MHKTPLNLGASNYFLYRKLAFNNGFINENLSTRYHSDKFWKEYMNFSTFFHFSPFYVIVVHSFGCYIRPQYCKNEGMNKSQIK